MTIFSGDWNSRNLYGLPLKKKSPNETKKAQVLTIEANGVSVIVSQDVLDRIFQKAIMGPD